MLFRKNNTQVNNEDIQEVSAAVRVLQLRKKMHTQLAFIACCLAVLSISSYAFITRAWFSNNREVVQDSTQITADAASASLYIRPTDGAKNFDVTLSQQATGDCKLFPISTKDLTNWYYVSQFGFESMTETVNGVDYIVSRQIATGYTLASPTDSEGKGVYTYVNSYESSTNNSVTKVAYFKSTSNLYSLGGDLAVYLDPDEPITVSTAAIGTSRAGFYESVRVGIKASGGATIIFAPVAESGSGNSTGSALNKFQAIVATTGAPDDASSVVKLTAGLSDFQGVDEGNGFYSAPQGGTSIGTATSYEEGGLDVEIFVWLEGTDAQALVGVADGSVATDPLDVSVKFVGVDPS